MGEPLLEAEFQYYLDNQTELAKKYEGKYIVIKNQQVLGAYEDQIEAIQETAKEHEVGTFLVQECDPDPESTVEIYHSRVHFS